MIVNTSLQENILQSQIITILLDAPYDGSSTHSLFLSHFSFCLLKQNNIWFYFA